MKFGAAYLLAAIAAVAGGQTIGVSSFAGDLITAFYPGEPAQITLTGFAPLHPVTIVLGSCAGTCAPFSQSFPQVAGPLLIDPATIVPIHAWDGLGIFGPPPTAALFTNLTGGLSFVIVLHAGAFPVLPWTLEFQVVSIPPLGSGALVALSNRITIQVTEPPPLAPISAISPSSVTEGVHKTVVIHGPIVLRSSVIPVVTFTSTCAPNWSALATNVQVVDTNPGSAVDPAIICKSPLVIGFPTLPPFTTCGPLSITVDYSAIYPSNPMNGIRTTSALLETDPTFIAMQSPGAPLISGVFVKASPTSPIAGLDTVSIVGTGFLNCCTVQFDAGGAGEVPSPSVAVASATQLVATVPPHAQGLVRVRVRNPDHLFNLPKESPAAPPATDFAYFALQPGQINVTVVAPSTIAEGSPPTPGVITGACPQVGGYSLLDPQSGPTLARVGSNILGTDADVALTASAAVIPSPGNFVLPVSFPGLPPGLHPPGPSGSAGPGLTNAGVKHVQILLPAQFGGAPHQTYALIPAAEPANRIVYRGPAPIVTSVLPNDVGRIDGAQMIQITGQNFFTEAPSLGAATAATTTAAAFQGPIAPTGLSFVAILDQQTLIASTPDLTPLGMPPPFTVDVAATNLDGQTGTGPHFTLYPSLSPTTPNGFGLNPGMLTLDTTPGGAAQVFSFLSDTTLPLGLILQAQGDTPLIIRCRGNLTVDATIDLRGGTNTGGPYGHPAGAGAGGAGVTAATLALQSATSGAPGTAPIDPATLLPYALVAGGGGVHVSFAGGGGSAGFAASGVVGGSVPFGTGGTAGLPYPFVPGPLPLPPPGISRFSVRLPPGGAGGGAGGIGVPPGFNPSTAVFANLGANGRGGNGGGGVFLACDGILTINGTIQTDGAAGGAGAINFVTGFAGGGGGGGSGGGLALAALQGIRINASGLLSSLGGSGGAGAIVTNPGGAASPGIIRIAIPLSSSAPSLVLQIAPAATITPAWDTTGF